MQYSPEIVKIEKYGKNFEIGENPQTKNLQIEYRFASEKERDIAISKLREEKVIEDKLSPGQIPKEGSFFVLKLSPTPSARLLNCAPPASNRILKAIQEQYLPASQLQWPKAGAAKPVKAVPQANLSADEIKGKIFEAVPAAYSFQIVGEGKRLRIVYQFLDNSPSLKSGREQLQDKKIGIIGESQENNWHYISVDPVKVAGGRFENIKVGLEALLRQQAHAGESYQNPNYTGL